MKMAKVASPTNAAMAARLERDVANLHGELTVAKRKLSSKTEALIILSADLDACRTERDQYKLMAEQLQARHVAIKKQLAGLDVDRNNDEVDVDQLWRLLAEHQAKSKSVALEAEDLRQRLVEAEGDNRALREQLGRHRMGEDDEAVSRRSWSSSEREALVATLEEERRKNENLKRDMREVFDHKEELVVERDALKTKHERLNREMNLLLKGDPERILDLDALTMENLYLKQELSRTKDEQFKAAATLTKYRTILEKRMAKVVGTGKSRTFVEEDHPTPSNLTTTPSSAASGLPASVEALGKKLLKISPDRASPQAVAHLQKFIIFLQESLQDRNLAIVHQRKTNQILAKKIEALENRLRHQGGNHPAVKSHSVEEFSNETLTSHIMRDGSSAVASDVLDADEAESKDSHVDEITRENVDGVKLISSDAALSFSDDDVDEKLERDKNGDSEEVVKYETSSLNNDAIPFSNFQSSSNNGDVFSSPDTAKCLSSLGPSVDHHHHHPHSSIEDSPHPHLSKFPDSLDPQKDDAPPLIPFDASLQLREEVNIERESVVKIDHGGGGDSRNLDDLLSWELFDGETVDVDAVSGDCGEGDGSSSPPAILTPTVLKSLF